jgi:hypothetical protein
MTETVPLKPFRQKMFGCEGSRDQPESVGEFYTLENGGRLGPGQAKRLKHPRRKFSASEDEQLRNLVAKFGDHNWTKVSLRLKTRSARQCRERFMNYLCPALKNDAWTEEEDNLLTEKFQLFGGKWSLLITFFPGRSEVNVKKRWTLLANRIHSDKRGLSDAEIFKERMQVIQALDDVIRSSDQWA